MQFIYLQVACQRERLLQQFEKEKLRNRETYAYINQDFYDNTLYNTSQFKNERQQPEVYNPIFGSSSIHNKQTKPITTTKQNLYSNKSILYDFQKYEYLNPINGINRRPYSYYAANNQLYAGGTATVIKNHKSKMYHNNTNGYTEPIIIEKPVKMQPEEIIIERSQLVNNNETNMNGDSDTGHTSGSSFIHQTTHLTQVNITEAIKKTHEVFFKAHNIKQCRYR